MRGPVRKAVHRASLMVCVLAVAVFCLPFVTGPAYDARSRSGAEELRDLQGASEDDGARDRSGLWELLDARNKEIAAAGSEVVCAGGTEDDDIDLAQWGLEHVAYLEVPACGVTLPVLLGAGDANLAQGAGHLTGTGYPIGGESVNCVIAAHRGWYLADMFRNLDYLEVGDTVRVVNFKETLAYRVREVRVTSPEDRSVCAVEEGSDLVTLVTCHPKWQVPRTQRLVVVCERAA